MESILVLGCFEVRKVFPYTEIFNISIKYLQVVLRKYKTCAYRWKCSYWYMNKQYVEEVLEQKKLNQLLRTVKWSYHSWIYCSMAEHETMSQLFNSLARDNVSTVQWLSRKQHLYCSKIELEIMSTLFNVREGNRVSTVQK